MSIKPQHLLSLLQEGFTTIQVRFPAELTQGDVRDAPIAREYRKGGRDEVKDYTYKISGPVEVGDTVVVDSPYSGLTCVKVVGVEVSDTFVLTPLTMIFPVSLVRALARIHPM